MREMKWLQRSLFRRLIISYLVPILLGFGVMGIVISTSTTDYIRQTAQVEMLRQAKLINLNIQDNFEVTPQLTSTLEFYDQTFDKRVFLFDLTGKIIAASNADEIYIGKEVENSIVNTIFEGNHVVRNMIFEELGSPGLSVIVPWGKEDDLYGGIVINAPVMGINESVRIIREIVLWSVLIGSLLTAILVSYLSWSISRPLKKIEYAATDIALGNYSKRVEYPALDEIGELAGAFNRMAEKLDIIEQERQSLEQKRDDFIANISHELRTPLTAMQGYLEALQDGLARDEDSRQRYYNIMHRESKHLNRLVDDLMDLIKLKNRKVSLDLFYIQLEEVIKKVLLTLQSSVNAKGNEISVRYPEQLPHILADSVRIEQIFLNLIHNANKFTENGKIIIDVSSNGKEMIIRITDSGVGIPSHDIEKVWDRFYKANLLASKEERGSGLGLAIVKELVELHEGKIEVESELGRGTKFTIVLPIHKKND
jgi:signal transduction histidine kinase